MPVAKTHQVEAMSVKHTPVLADGELAHPFQDEQLDFGQLCQVHERFDVGFARPHQL